MIAIRQTVLQNRMALDFILAEKGGTCAIIDTECCTYIPDESTNITSLSEHTAKEIDSIKKVGQDLHGFTEGSKWWSSKACSVICGA